MQKGFLVLGFSLVDKLSTTGLFWYKFAFNLLITKNKYMNKTQEVGYYQFCMYRPFVYLIFENTMQALDIICLWQIDY